MGRFGWCACLLAGALASVAAACGNPSPPPIGQGDKVFVDVDATNQGLQPGQPVGDGGGFDAPVSEGGYYGAPDGYAPYATCQSCACPATGYCFGGGTGYTSFSGDCNPAAFGIGCQALPPECPDASCECLIGVVGKQLPCYPVCVQNTRTLYCPSP